MAARRSDRASDPRYSKIIRSFIDSGIARRDIVVVRGEVGDLIYVGKTNEDVFGVPSTDRAFISRLLTLLNGSDERSVARFPVSLLFIYRVFSNHDILCSLDQLYRVLHLSCLAVVIVDRDGRVVLAYIPKPLRRDSDRDPLGRFDSIDALVFVEEESVGSIEQAARKATDIIKRFYTEMFGKEPTVRVRYTILCSGDMPRKPDDIYVDYLPTAVVQTGAEYSLDELLPAQIRDEIFRLVVYPYKKNLPVKIWTVLLVGPPGTGKSAIGRAILKEVVGRYVVLSPWMYRIRWYGESERTLHRLLEMSRRVGGLLLDDAEFIGTRKLRIDSSGDVAIVSEITIILSFLQREDKPFTVLTSNMPEQIDEAILRAGRVDMIVALGYPDRMQRKRVVLNVANKYGVRIDDDVLEYIADVTEWYTPAEVAELVKIGLIYGEGRLTKEIVDRIARRFRIDRERREMEQKRLRNISTYANVYTIVYAPLDHEFYSVSMHT